MKRFYSFVVFCEVEEAQFPQYGVLLTYGTEAFNLVVDDVESFERDLKSAGVRIISRHDLSYPIDGTDNVNGSVGMVVGSSVLGVSSQAGYLAPASEHEAGSIGGDLVGDEVEPSSDKGTDELLDRRSDRS